MRNEATDECVAIAERYRDLQVGLTDASLVALAARLGTTEIASFDKPHFRVVRPTWRGDVFRLLPADA